jgi:hypothetical protein
MSHISHRASVWTHLLLLLCYNSTFPITNAKEANGSRDIIGTGSFFFLPSGQTSFIFCNQVPWSQISPAHGPCIILYILTIAWSCISKKSERMTNLSLIPQTFYSLDFMICHQQNVCLQLLLWMLHHSSYPLRLKHNCSWFISIPQVISIVAASPPPYPFTFFYIHCLFWMFPSPSFLKSKVMMEHTP